MPVQVCVRLSVQAQPVCMHCACMAQTQVCNRELVHVQTVDVHVHCVCVSVCISVMGVAYST
jgi:hypothetical protein